MYRDTIFQYVKKQYGTIPEYLWNDLPDSAILRNDNGKWYAVFMNLEGFKIGLDTKDRVDIMVVKCKPDMISVMTHMKGFLPGSPRYQPDAYVSYLPSVSPEVSSYGRYHHHNTWQVRLYALLLPSLAQ